MLTKASQQPQTCSTSPTSSGNPNPPFTPSTSPSANTSKSNPASKSSTSAAGSSSTLQKYYQTPLPITRCLVGDPPSWLTPLLNKRTDEADGSNAGLTWIIIILIILSIAVTCSEVFLRFGILTKEKSNSAKGLPMCVMPSGLVMPITHDGLL